MKIIGKLSDGENLVSISEEEIKQVKDLCGNLLSAFGVEGMQTDKAVLGDCAPDVWPPIRLQKKKRGRQAKVKSKAAAVDKPATAGKCVICGSPAKGISKICGKPECKREHTRRQKYDWWKNNRKTTKKPLKAPSENLSDPFLSDEQRAEIKEKRLALIRASAKRTAPK